MVLESGPLTLEVRRRVSRNTDLKQRPTHRRLESCTNSWPQHARAGVMSRYEQQSTHSQAEQSSDDDEQHTEEASILSAQGSTHRHGGGNRKKKESLELARARTTMTDRGEQTHRTGQAGGNYRRTVGSFSSAQALSLSGVRPQECAGRGYNLHSHFRRIAAHSPQIPRPYPPAEARGRGSYGQAPRHGDMQARA